MKKGASSWTMLSKAFDLIPTLNHKISQDLSDIIPDMFQSFAIKKHIKPNKI